MKLVSFTVVNLFPLWLPSPRLTPAVPLRLPLLLLRLPRLCILFLSSFFSFDMHRFDPRVDPLPFPIFDCPSSIPSFSSLPLSYLHSILFLRICFPFCVCLMLLLNGTDCRCPNPSFYFVSDILFNLWITTNLKVARLASAKKVAIYFPFISLTS